MAQTFKGKIMVNGNLIDMECEFISREQYEVGDIACVSGVGFALVTKVEEPLGKVCEKSV